MKLSKAQETQLHELAFAGTPNKAIAATMDIPLTEVHAHRSRLGITRDKVAQATGKPTEAAVQQMTVKPTLRGVTSEGQYTISNPATEILMPLYAHIALVGTWDWLTLKARRRARPTHGIEFKSDISYVHYSGRKLPVAEISEFEDRTHSFDFTFGRSAPPGSLERLSAMAGRLVAYKDSQGDFATGILEGLSVSKDIASDISFSIVEVDTS